MIAALLILGGIYVICGLLFAVPFLLLRVKQIDPHAARGSWGFLLRFFPGAVARWSLLLRCWLKGISEPPEERSGHRQAAKGIAP
jgi:hypothetical protein